MLASTGTRREISIEQLRASSAIPQRAGHRDQVNDGVGRSADRHVDGDGVLEGLAASGCREGFRSSQTISTMRRPQSIAMRT